MRHIAFSSTYLVRKKRGGSGGRCWICGSEWGFQWHSEGKMAIGVDDEEWLSRIGVSLDYIWMWMLDLPGQWFFTMDS